MRYKVIQWGTGVTGSSSVRQIAQRPDLELVAVKVYSDAKAKQDAGTLCGTVPVGVLTTTDRDEIIATQADVVLYMGAAESDTQQCAADIVELLASGKNVIATPTPFQNPHVVDPELGRAFENACAAGNSSFLGLGLFPGFMAESVCPCCCRACVTEPSVFASPNRFTTATMRATI